MRRVVISAVSSVLAVMGLSYASNLVYDMQSKGAILTDSKGNSVQLFTNKPAKEAVTTFTTGTKAAYKNISTITASKTMLALYVHCTDGAGTAIPCRAYYNGGTTGVPITSGERVFGIHPSTKYIKFGTYSTTTSKTVYLTTESQEQ